MDASAAIARQAAGWPHDKGARQQRIGAMEIRKKNRDMVGVNPPPLDQQK